MRLHAVGLLSVALAVCLSAAVFAQEEGRTRGRGGPGGPGGPGGGRGGMMGGMMGGMSMGGALDLVGLLRIEEVQKEVKLEPEAAKAAADALPDMRSLFGASESERPALLKEANAKAQEVLDEVLSPEQQKRLMGLYVQQAGNRAAANDLIAKEIGLDEAGVAKVKEAAAKSMTAMREKMQEMRDSGNMDFAKMREMMETVQQDTDKAIAAVMTDEQKQALEKLKGDKFTFPERGGFGGGRGGPGGGPRGADAPGGPRGGAEGGRNRPERDGNRDN